MSRDAPLRIVRGSAHSTISGARELAFPRGKPDLRVPIDDEPLGGDRPSRSPEADLVPGEADRPPQRNAAATSSCSAFAAAAGSAAPCSARPTTSMLEPASIAAAGVSTLA